MKKIQRTLPDNIKTFCAACHAEVSASRAESRKALKLAVLCKSCAEKNTKVYLGADQHGELVKTTDPHAAQYIRSYHKGSHAIQG